MTALGSSTTSGTPPTSLNPEKSGDFHGKPAAAAGK